jgi:hypothetical protein
MYYNLFVAQQTAERQKYLVDKARYETDAQVIIADGQAEAAKLVS